MTFDAKEEFKKIKDNQNFVRTLIKDLLYSYRIEDSIYCLYSYLRNYCLLSDDAKTLMTEEEREELYNAFKVLLKTIKIL